jgi:hypothetical protein
MNEVFPVPSTTGFEAIVSLVSALVYLAVGVASLIQAPRDIRARLFLLIAVVNVPAYFSAIDFWRQGSAAAWSQPLVLALWMSTSLAAVALFHFAQVFPWRRRWIARHAAWLWLAYALAPAPVGVLIAAAPTSFDEVGVPFLVASFAIGLPAIAVVGLLLPLAGLTSIYKSYLAAKRDGIEPARVTLLWILISQLAGGVLAIIVIPMLHMVAPVGPYASIASGVLLITGLLMPAAFAMGVWRYRILSLDPAAPPAHLDRPFG